MYSKQHTVLITNILMTSHFVDCQIYDILYNLSIDSSHFILYTQCNLFPFYVCTVVTRKGRVSLALP